MLSVLTGLHVLICVGLIIVVLLQTGRGSGMASVFGGGGGGGGALMGGKGFGGILAKATAALAILFMLTSITLSLIPRGGGTRESLLGGGTPSGQPSPQGEQQGPVESTPPEAAPEEPVAEPPAGTPSGE